MTLNDSDGFRSLNEKKKIKEQKEIQKMIDILKFNNINYTSTHTINVVSIKLNDDFIQVSLKKKGNKVKYCFNQKWDTINLDLLINKIIDQIIY
jgi:hypothetical protein